MGKTTSHFRCIVQNKIYSIAKTGSAYIHYMCRNSLRNQMNMILMCCSKHNYCHFESIHYHMTKNNLLQMFRLTSSVNPMACQYMQNNWLHRLCYMYHLHMTNMMNHSCNTLHHTPKSNLLQMFRLMSSMSLMACQYNPYNWLHRPYYMYRLHMANMMNRSCNNVHHTPTDMH